MLLVRASILCVLGAGPLTHKIDSEHGLGKHTNTNSTEDMPGSLNMQCDSTELILRERCLSLHCENLTDSASCQARASASIALLGNRPACERRSRFFFHLYWSGPMKRTIALTLWSLLWSQSCARIILWHMGMETLQSGGGFQLLQPLKLFHQLQLRQFDALKLSAGTLLEDFVVQRAPLFESTNGPARAVGFSDFVRFLVLQKYGGIYTDADVMWLRDAWPFRGHEFAYRWSYLPHYNTAVMALERNSNIGAQLIEAAAAASQHNLSLSFEAFHPHRLAGYCQERGLQWDMLPSALFDPLWLHFDLVTRRKRRDRTGNYPADVGEFQARFQAAATAEVSATAEAAFEMGTVQKDTKRVLPFPFESFDDFFLDKKVIYTTPSFIDRFFRGSFAVSVGFICTHT
jgi:hypothetical protein